jgi:methionyl-tRNA formyltransferase
VAQSAHGVTYAKKIVPDEAKIDWKRPAREVLRHVHGLNPVPGAWTMAGEARLKLLRVRLASGGGVAGTMIAAPFVVACGEGALEVLELQRAGRGAQGVDEFRRGFPLAVGARLG